MSQAAHLCILKLLPLSLVMSNEVGLYKQQSMCLFTESFSCCGNANYKPNQVILVSLPEITRSPPMLIRICAGSFVWQLKALCTVLREMPKFAFVFSNLNEHVSGNQMTALCKTLEP